MTKMVFVSLLKSRKGQVGSTLFLSIGSSFFYDAAHFEQLHYYYVF